MKEFKLKNNIEAVYKQNINTPRVAISMNVAINEPEKLAGTHSLMNKLLMQGTKNRTSEELANELDENAIEINCDMKQDYLRFRAICLNEDIELAVEILSDIIKNSTFEEFDKEKIKMEGEISAELDSAKTQALDNYVKTLFKNHYYGNTFTNVLKNIKNITKEDVVESYKKIMKTGRKVLSFVGDIEFDKAQDILNKYLGDIENSDIQPRKIEAPVLTKKEVVEIIKPDAQQAQVYQGWILPNFNHADYPAILVLNTILGSCGLSSRLFLELRDKKGLAYTVRSSYENYGTVANFSIYIATEPKNIETSLAGFKEELQKLKDVLVSETELQNGKNNYIGKQQFIGETNAQQANTLVFHGIMGLGFDFQPKLLQMVREVTSEDIQRVARTYFNDNTVISLLHP